MPTTSAAINLDPESELQDDSLPPSTPRLAYCFPNLRGHEGENDEATPTFTPISKHDIPFIRGYFHDSRDIPCIRVFNRFGFHLLALVLAYKHPTLSVSITTNLYCSFTMCSTPAWVEGESPSFRLPHCCLELQQAAAGQGTYVLQTHVYRSCRHTFIGP